VRLAALDLREISGDGSGGPGLVLGILGFYVFSPQFTRSHFLLNVTFLSKLHRIRCRCRASRRLHDVSNDFGLAMQIYRLRDRVGCMTRIRCRHC